MFFSTLKVALTPGSILFLLLCVLVWLVLRYRFPRTRRIGRAWLSMVFIGYLGMALPCVATGIVGRLPRIQPADTAAWRAVDTLVVLAGDNPSGRAHETARVNAAVRPAVIVVLGDDLLVDEIRDAGVPRDRLTLEDSPSTTRTQMAWVEHRAAQSPGDHIGLVASRVQMPRVAALVRAAGLTLTLIPSPIDTEPATTGAWRFVPMYSALCASRDALYEHAALVYYRWRGWTGPV